MARSSATAAFLLLLSLLALAHSRALEAEAESTAVVAVGDETGPPNPTLPAEAGATDTEDVPTEQHGFLLLPSHRRHHHHPCRHGLFHRHLWWARHHGVFRDSHLSHRHGEAEALPTELVRDGELRETEDEVKPVAEPDPDRSLPDGDGEGEEDDGAAVKRWKKEVLWRMFRHGLHRHHGLRDHFKEEDHEHEEEGAEVMKRFHRHDHDHDHDEEEKKMRKRFRHAEHEDSDSDDDEDDEVEEMVRRFRKAIMRRRFGHGRRFHHHRHHGRDHRTEEAEKADGEQEQEQEGGVMTWIKGLMNRF